MDEQKKEYIAGLLEQAEADLDDHIEKQAELRERFESLKPEIEEVAAHPSVEAEDPADALECRREAFQRRAEEAEDLRQQIEEILEELVSLIEGLTGEAGALSPVQSLDRFADEEELLDEAKRILERYQIYRHTQFDTLKESLLETTRALIHLHDMYSEQAFTIENQLRNLREEKGAS